MTSDKSVLEEEMKDIEAATDSLQKELEALQTKSCELEGISKENEELCQKLQHQCEESKQDFDRQLKLNKKSENLSEQNNCEIEAFKLNHRKLRSKFENQLYQLIDQEKNLHVFFIPEKLPAALENAEITKDQLLTTDEQKLAQLSSLNEEIEKVKAQKQLAITAVVQED